MSSEFPQSHTTATGPPSSATPPSSKPFLDLSYITSIPGLFKVVEIILCFITFCICAGSGGWGQSGWSAFVTFTAFLGALIFLLIFAFHVHDMLPKLPWGLIELVFYGVYAVLLLISFFCMVALATWGGATAGAGAFFVLVCCILFGVDAFFKFKAWRNSAPPPAPSQPAAGGYPA